MASHSSNDGNRVLHQIRSAQSHDLDQLRQIDVECFGKSALPVSQMKWLLEGQGESPAFFIRVAHDLEQFDRILGFICWKVKAELERSYFEILDLSVGREFRDENVEDALVMDAISAANDAGCIGITVNVPQANVHACAFYLRNGFQIQHTVKSYYDDGSSMDVMVRRLR
jgi:ribosomal protein S18 acetylase RimI-like enzyme